MILFPGVPFVLIFVPVECDFAQSQHAVQSCGQKSTPVWGEMWYISSAVTTNSSIIVNKPPRRPCGGKKRFTAGLSHSASHLDDARLSCPSLSFQTITGRQPQAPLPLPSRPQERTQLLPDPFTRDFLARQSCR
jgi:hypothetical protein